MDVQQPLGIFVHRQVGVGMKLDYSGRTGKYSSMVAIELLIVILIVPLGSNWFVTGKDADIVWLGVLFCFLGATVTVSLLRCTTLLVLSVIRDYRKAEAAEKAAEAEFEATHGKRIRTALQDTADRNVP